MLSCLIIWKIIKVDYMGTDQEPSIHLIPPYELHFLIDTQVNINTLLPKKLLKFCLKNPNSPLTAKYTLPLN